MLKLSRDQLNRFFIPEIGMYRINSLPSFSCKRCARCCKGKIVPLYQKDIERIRSRVEEKFYGSTTKVERSITGASYKMLMNDSRCTFLRAGLCKYYDLRPNTCRRHPFLATGRHLLASSTCPGIKWESDTAHNNGEAYFTLSSEIARGIDSFLRRNYII